MIAWRRNIFPLIVVLALSNPAAAQIEVTLPFHGYYRVGQYMPVHLRVTGGGLLRDITLFGDGILTTTVSASGSEIVVPVLVIGSSARELNIAATHPSTDRRLPVREVSDGQPMIGILGEASDELVHLVPPVPTIIRIRLDRSLIQIAPPIALEMLQALVVDDASRMDVGAWAASGVALLLAGERRPDDSWPWVEFAGGSLLGFDALGPSTAMMGEAAYLPATSWSPGAPRMLRRQVVLAGVLYAIATAACALLGKRKTVVVSLTLATLGGSIILFAWQRSHSPLRQFGWQIAVDHEPLVQWDRWTYFTTRSSAPGSMPFVGAGRPVLVDAAHARAAALQMHWSDDPTRRSFSFALPPGATISFVSRIVTKEWPTWELAALDGSHPLIGLARGSYVDDRHVIAGQVELHDGPLVLIVKKP